MTGRQRGLPGSGGLFLRRLPALCRRPPVDRLAGDLGYHELVVSHSLALPVAEASKVRIQRQRGT